MLKKNKGGNSGKKSASLIISNNFSLLDPDNEETDSSPVVSDKSGIRKGNNGGANAEVAAAQETNAAGGDGPDAEQGYKLLKLRSVYIHNQSWKTIA